MFVYVNDYFKVTQTCLCIEFWVERIKTNKTLEKLHAFGAKAIPKLNFYFIFKNIEVAIILIFMICEPILTYIINIHYSSKT
jgi:hypothetical protein